MSLKYFAHDHPIQRVEPRLLALLGEAQENHVHQVFHSAADLLNQVFDELRISIKAAEKLFDLPAAEIADRPHRELVQFFITILTNNGVPATAVGLQAQACAREMQLLRAFSSPTRVMEKIKGKVRRIVDSFPRTVEDIECGKNPGDVIDPFILTAAQTLMYGGDFDGAIGAAVAHKALMIVEDLLGHLHEDVIGEMRGNVRAPEPRGRDQELLDPATNPFPGADLVQPPYAAGTTLRFHQIKNKTGSAKGGDGLRLGQQLELLRQLYGGDIYYDALIGTTLRGHRSRAGVERGAPGIVVLVGDAAFSELTWSAVGPELLLRMYQAAFESIAVEAGYSVQSVVLSVVASFRERAERHGEDLMEVILRDVVSGSQQNQDSRHSLPRSSRGSRERRN